MDKKLFSPLSTKSTSSEKSIIEQDSRLGNKIQNSKMQQRNRKKNHSLHIGISCKIRPGIFPGFLDVNRPNSELCLVLSH